MSEMELFLEHRLLWYLEKCREIQIDLYKILIHPKSMLNAHRCPIRMNRKLTSIREKT